MARKQPSVTEATVKYANAQLDEARARESVHPDRIHEDTAGAMEAKAVQIEALHEIDAALLAAREGEEKVTLVGPNPRANLTDANGVEFKDGKAEGVPKSLAERYARDFDGYEIQGKKTDS